jgi:hypothetical protein
MQNYIQTLALSSAVVCVLFDKMAAVAFMSQIIANHHKKSKTIFILAIYKYTNKCIVADALAFGETRRK